MEYTTLREPQKLPKGKQSKRQVKCPSGFYFDKDKGRCVQAGVRRLQK